MLGRGLVDTRNPPPKDLVVLGATLNVRGEALHEIRGGITMNTATATHTYMRGFLGTGGLLTTWHLGPLPRINPQVPIMGI